jgi:hypothetical protein
MLREPPAWARWLALALLVLAAFSAGRFSAPLQVEERTQVQLVYRDRVVEKRVELAARVETRVVYRDRVVTPDGTVTEHELERSGAATTVAAAEVREVVREVEKRVGVEKRIELRPDWRISVSAGASLQRPTLPLAGPLVVGLEVDRRIAGGVSAGLWLSTSGAAGAAVAFEF